MGMVMIDGRVVSSGQCVWIAAAARQSRLFENFGTEKKHTLEFQRRVRMETAQRI